MEMVELGGKVMWGNDAKWSEVKVQSKMRVQDDTMVQGMAENPILQQNTLTAIDFALSSLSFQICIHNIR